MSSKLLPCLFESDVMCSHVHETNFGVIHRCLNCKFYFDYCREMEAEEDEFFEELDRLVESEKLDG
jgi:hypothetical protein